MNKRNETNRTAARTVDSPRRREIGTLESPVIWGGKIPTLITPEYLESPSRPRAKMNGDKQQATGTSGICLRTSSLEPVASSLLPKRTRTEPIISSIQLLSCGDCERRMPLKSKEDSENAVGVAPVGVPLDRAMAVGTPGRKPSG
jgi:hypothetical protein